MALGMYFKPSGFATDVYDDAIARLNEAGAGSPPGRKFHFAFTGEDGGIQVFDVWDSQEEFDQFGETLVPIMAALGADPGQPVVMQIHNTVLG